MPHIVGPRGISLYIEGEIIFIANDSPLYQIAIDAIDHYQKSKH